VERQLGRPCDLPVSIVSLDELLNGSVRRYPCVAALGAFDGVHLGHQAILESAREKAQALGGCSIALTFDRLPAEVLKPKQAPMLITLPEARFSLLERMVDEVVVIPFDQQLIHLEATDFIEQALIKGLGTVGVVVGFNYTFGKGARGTAELLQRYAAAKLLNVTVVPPVEAAGGQVSSTRIRKHIDTGEIALANALLGRPFRLTGQVIAGDARGRVLGYPTANVAVDSRLILPHPGVYVTRFQSPIPNNPALQETHTAVTAISNRPTFSGKDISVESFVLDYDRDLYGQVVYLDFLHRLRDIRRFNDAAELSAQIARDVEAARAYVKQHRRC
jgi:riboflavin kinase/FMN adenylyltransferase